MNTFLKARNITLNVIFLLFYFVFIYTHTTLAKENKIPDVIKVAIDNNYPPYVFLDEEGRLQGFLIDLWHLWEQKNNIKVEIYGMDWALALKGMEAGDYDVLDTVFFTPERAKIYDYSKPYENIDVPIIFHKDIQGITGIESLKDMPVAVKKGDAAIDFLKERGAHMLLEFPSYEAIVKAAKENKVMVMVIDKPPAFYLMYKLGILHQFKHTKPLYIGQFHRAVKKGNTFLLNLVEQGFEKITAKEYETLREKWFGIGTLYLLSPYLSYLALFVGTVLLFFLVLFLWNHTLRKKVNQKTRALEEEVQLHNKTIALLQRSEERYRSLFENAAEGIFQCNEAQVFVSVNPAFSRIMGYNSPKEFLDTGRSFMELFRDPMECQGFLNTLEERGKVEGFETILIDKNGSGIWVHMSANITKKELVTGFEGSIIDVTARKKVEEKYRLLTELATDVIWITDLDFNTIYVNPAIEKVLGYTVEERLMQDPKTILTPESYQKAKELLLEQLHLVQIGAKDPNDSIVVELDYYHKNGHLVSTESVVRFTLDEGGKVNGIHGITRDITERKQAMKALEESEDKYRTLFMSAQEGILIAQDERMILVNPALVEILGHGEDVLTSRPFVDFIHPEDKAMVLECHRRRLRGEDVPSNYEFRIVSGDGTTKWVRINSKRISFKDRPAILSFVEDVTERKKMEEEKARLEDQLRHAQKMEAIGVLAGGIAHNFNNLLTSILGYASLMAMDKNLPEKYREWLRIIENQVKSGADLTSQLLGFARRGRYQVKRINLAPFLKNFADMFAATRKDIIVHKNVAKDLWVTEVDLTQMEQVLMNLFVNASQAMPEGGHIYLSSENVILDSSYPRLRSNPPGRYVKISVTDTGEGMDQATLGRIFEPFFTTKAMGKGTGLGLATVYGIVKGHGGIINAYSEKGHGTTFNIYLPAVDEPGDGLEKQVPEQRIEKGTGTILLVDDQEEVRITGKEMLEELGYEVLLAKDGGEAIRIYKEKMEEISLVILDLIMPEMSGKETFFALKGLNPQIKVLLSSGYSEESHASEIIQQGAKGFLQKPFGLVALSHRLKEALQK